MPVYDELGLIRLSQGEHLSADDYAFTDRNIATISALLRRIGLHRHDGAEVAGGPAPSAPTLEVSADFDGAFVANSEVFYRVAKVVAGIESPASAATSVVTPPPLDPPDAPELEASASGGALQAGVYEYAVTAYRDHNTLESTASSTPINLAVSGGDDQQVTITVSLPFGATGYNVYRRSPGSVTWNYLASVVGSTPYVDDGSVAASAERLVPYDDSSSHSAIEVTPPAGLLSGQKWRVYRSSLEEEWGASLLVELEFGFDSPFVDTGIATGAGSPIPAPITFFNPEKIDLESEVDGVLPPERGGGGFTYAQLFVASAYNGTATEFLPLYYTPGSLADGLVPADFTAGSPIDVADLEVALASPYYPDGLVFVVPTGAGRGPYHFTAATDFSAPLTTATGYDFVTDGSTWRALRTSTGYKPIVPPAPSSLDPGVWVGPEAPGGGTVSLATGEVVFVPFDLEADQDFDMVRIGTTVAGATGAKVMVYLARGSTGPDALAGSVEVDVDAAPGDILDDLVYDGARSGRWWLGVHNHIAALSPATFHAHAAGAQLRPLTLAAPSSADGNTGLKATGAGTAALTSTGSLSFTAVPEAPVIQIRTA